jgi:hypothetical protein
VTPASLWYFAIYDPSLEDEEDNSNQLLLYLSNEEEEPDMNTKIRRIGLVTGMNAFCEGFGDHKGSNSLKCVELEDSRILLSSFEGRYNFVISLSLRKIVEDDGETVSYDKSISLRFHSNLVAEGYNEFRLHNGTISSLYETMERSEFIDYLERWWRVWFQNYQLELTENGFLKQFEKGYHRSALKLDSELKYNVDDIFKFSQFKEFLVWNSGGFENFGLVYEHFKSLDQKSKTKLLKWLELTSYYGITTDHILANNIPKIQSTDREKDSNASASNPSEGTEIYDPFKLVYDTMSYVSKSSGITSGVNYSMKTVSDGFSTMNSYIPWGISKKNASEITPPNEEHITQTINQHSGEVAERPFLVGKVNDSSIVYKNLYLKFTDEDEETLHRLVVFQHGSQLIILIYQFNANELNDLNYYDELLAKLSKLSKVHLPKQPVVSSKRRNFYFIGVDRLTNTIESSLPYIPRRDILESSDDAIEEHEFNDLAANKTQCQLIHKELTDLVGDVQNPSTDIKAELKERLNITRNGWWIYNYNNGPKSVYILRKSRKVNGARHSNTAALLDISANVNDILGKEAKEWLDTYISGY